MRLTWLCGFRYIPKTLRREITFIYFGLLFFFVFLTEGKAGEAFEKKPGRYTKGAPAGWAGLKPVSPVAVRAFRGEECKAVILGAGLAGNSATEPFLRPWKEREVVVAALSDFPNTFPENHTEFLGRIFQEVAEGSQLEPITRRVVKGLVDERKTREHVFGNDFFICSIDKKCRLRRGFEWPTFIPGEPRNFTMDLLPPFEETITDDVLVPGYLVMQIPPNTNFKNWVDWFSYVVHAGAYIEGLEKLDRWVGKNLTSTPRHRHPLFVRFSEKGPDGKPHLSRRLTAWYLLGRAALAQENFMQAITNQIGERFKTQRAAFLRIAKRFPDVAEELQRLRISDTDFYASVRALDSLIVRDVKQPGASAGLAPDSILHERGTPNDRVQLTLLHDYFDATLGGLYPTDTGLTKGKENPTYTAHVAKALEVDELPGDIRVLEMPSLKSGEFLVLESGLVIGLPPNAAPYEMNLIAAKLREWMRLNINLLNTDHEIAMGLTKLVFYQPDVISDLYRHALLQKGAWPELRTFIDEVYSESGPTPQSFLNYVQVLLRGYVDAARWAMRIHEQAKKGADVPQPVTESTLDFVMEWMTNVNFTADYVHRAQILRLDELILQARVEGDLEKEREFSQRKREFEKLDLLHFVWHLPSLDRVPEILPDPSFKILRRMSSISLDTLNLDGE